MVSIYRTILALSIAMAACPALRLRSRTVRRAPACANPDALGTSRTLEVGGAPELG